MTLLPRVSQSPPQYQLISGIVKSSLKGNHSLAVFTLEAKKHPFPADGAGLRHPILGGKPVRKKQEMSEVGQWPWAPLQQDEPQDEWEDYKPWIPALFVPEQVIINVNQVA